MKKKLKKIVVAFSIVTIFLTVTYWYWFIPDGSGRIRAAKWALEKMPGDIFLQRVASFRQINDRISNFYLTHERMPTPKEIIEVRSEGEAVVRREGWYQYVGENYYHYGYETGECSFLVESLCSHDCFDEQFRKGYLPIINNTMTQLEHTWLIYEQERDWVYYLEPEILSIQSFFTSPTCLWVIGEMEGRKKELYQEIRNELLQQIEEGTYDENICVLSLPFQRRMAKRKEREGASHTEPSAHHTQNTP